MINKAKVYLRFVLSSMILMVSLSSFANAALCNKEQQISIKLGEKWYKNEEIRLLREKKLLEQYSNYISKNEKNLIAEKYSCLDKKNCNPIKNCQIEKDIKDLREIEYLIKTDSGIIIAKSYCNKIGKCVGYNDFFHDGNITVSENRLIDIKHDNAIFYHYFYSAKLEGYEPLFNMTNFHTGYELYLQDIPHFSPDDRFMIEVHSIAKNENLRKDFPVGFNINIYEINEYGEYKNIEPEEFDKEDQNKVISTFLSRNPSCGKNPYFQSWKSNYEARLINPISEENSEEKKVILLYDKKLKKWSCKEDEYSYNQFTEFLPDPFDDVSNISQNTLQ